MAKSTRQWIRVRTLSAEEKRDIAAACDRFIAEKLKPRFLPEIRPTKFNYPVDIVGRWRANKYSFITRYRSDRLDRLKDEWDAPFTRLDHLEERLGEICFDVMWMRHTGQWWRLHSGVTLEAALHLIETDELLWPTT